MHTKKTIQLFHATPGEMLYRIHHHHSFTHKKHINIQIGVSTNEYDMQKYIQETRKRR